MKIQQLLLIEDAIMNQNAKQLLNHLCTEYDKLSRLQQTRPFPEFSETIKSEHGYCYVRCAVGSQRFSIVAVNFNPTVRGQGVLSTFIDYIRQNPHQYSGVEVAIIENQGLAKHLLALGWQYKSYFSKLFFSKRPTLVQNFCN